MTKSVNMTRERKIALPVILEAAQRYVSGDLCDSRAQEARIRAALETFRSDK